MSFDKDYSNVKGVYLNGSIECLDTLDYLTHRIRDEENRGLFACKYDPQRNIYFYSFYSCDIEFPFGSYVYLDFETDTLYIEFDNRLVGFHLPTIQDNIKEIRYALHY